MNLTKEEIITELINRSIELDKTPRRRDFSRSFYNVCCKQFGSFNKAKEAAGLKIHRRICEPLSADSKKYSLELVRIVSYITGDGHLHEDLKGFLHSSKDLDSLKDFEYCVKKQFGMEISKIQENFEEGESTGVLQYRYFNTNISKFLYSIGTPKGDKVITV